MRHTSIIQTTLALAIAATLMTLAPAAFAHGRGHAYGHRGYHRVACAPRYVVYRPAPVVVVRPAPYVVVGTRIGPVDISAVFGPSYHEQLAYCGR